MASGGTHGIASDCGGCNLDVPNLADQLEQAGISWKAYMEGLPAPSRPCSTLPFLGHAGDQDTASIPALT